jgi:hypothetical protein
LVEDPSVTLDSTLAAAAGLWRLLDATTGTSGETQPRSEPQLPVLTFSKSQSLYFSPDRNRSDETAKVTGPEELGFAASEHEVVEA